MSKKMIVVVPPKAPVKKERRVPASKVQKAPLTQVEVEGLFSEYGIILKQESDIASKKAEIKKVLDEYVMDQKEQSIEVTDSSGSHWKATTVSAERVSIDPDKLRETVGEEVWEDIKVNAFDQKKLQEVIKNGDVTLRQVEQVSTTTKNKPYVRYSNS